MGGGGGGEKSVLQTRGMRRWCRIKKYIGVMDCGVRLGWKELNLFSQWWNLILRF